MFFAAGPLEAAVTNRAFGFAVPEGREGMAGYGSYACTMDALEAAVSNGPYVAGGRFTAADLYLGSHIGWGLAFGSIEKRPAFERYWERVGARPAALRARAIDDALLAGREHAPPA